MSRSKRSQVLPQANTESAREARRAFFCELCQKGYARQNEFEAHEGSYDHQHRKRLKEMRQLTKDPNAAKKARVAERMANEQAGLISLNNNTSALPTKRKPAPPPESETGEGASSIIDGDAVERSDEDDTEDEGWTPQQKAQWDRTMELCDDEMRPLDRNDPFFAKMDGWAEERYQPDLIQLSQYNPLTGERRECPLTIKLPNEIKWSDEDDERFMKEHGWENWYDINPRGLLR